MALLAYVVYKTNFRLGIVTSHKVPIDRLGRKAFSAFGSSRNFYSWVTLTFTRSPAVVYNVHSLKSSRSGIKRVASDSDYSMCDLNVIMWLPHIPNASHSSELGRALFRSHKGIVLFLIHLYLCRVIPFPTWRTIDSSVKLVAVVE